MIDCLILGDSIAVGTHMARPECVSYSKGGINSSDWNKRYGHNELKAGTVIISLGSNDLKGLDTLKELRTLRSTVKGSRVFWILPAIKPAKQQIVNDIAAEYGDTVLPIRQLQPDGVHPTGAGYRELAKSTL